VQSHRGGFHNAPLQLASSEAIRGFCRAHNVTPFMVLLAAFKALLGRHSGHYDIAVGTYTANRDREELEPLIGFFLNTLVLRTRFEPTQGFGELVRRVRETAVGAYAHQAMPFATLVRELAPERDLSSNPLVQVVFQLQNAASFDESQGAHSLVDYQRGAAIFDIAVTCYELEGALSCDLGIFDRPVRCQHD
jgi:non-ribosomal peptide synthetase component F